MEFEDLIRLIEKEFRVEKTRTGTYIVSRGGRIAEVAPHENCCYESFLRFFKAVPKDSDVGHDDLHPKTRIGDRVSGSLVDEEHPLFGTRALYKGDDLRFPRFAKFDPMGPTKDRSRGFDPDPDHLRKPDGPNGGML